MHTTTLRGVFPEPKTAYRRNFIKENVKSIKQMQGFLQEAGVIQPKHSKTISDKFQTNPLPRYMTTASRDSTPPRRQRSISDDAKSHSSKLSVKRAMGTNVGAPRLRLEKKVDKHEPSIEDKFTNRSMQTERLDDITKLYETGVIKYPSPGILRSTSPKYNSPHKHKIESRAQGDIIEKNLENDMQNLDMDDKDYIRENMTNIKPKLLRQPQTKVPAQAPPTYQRGVVPKYLRDRKEEENKEEEEPCPEGHVLLPEEERKETLRVLRQSYADRIQELNSLPVRSDTLRIKKRKMEIEEELKRIDGGIKVFQRPKVYVKINA